MPSPARDYEDAHVLVTGGAGCIGSNLTRALAEAGASSITVLDDLSAASEWNVPKHPAVRFVRGSVRDEATLRSVFSKKPDYVFHLAAFFANQNSVDHPEEDLLTNGLGTLKVLTHSREAKVQRFVYASSGCSVYGAEAPLPMAEDYVSLSLDTPYQVTKLLGELYSNYFRNLHGLPTVNLRFFNVYGPGEVPGRYRNVIPNFFWWARRREPLPLTGTGKETRDFTFVGDVVNGILAAGLREQAVGQAINLASGKETRIGDLATKINKITENPAGTQTRPRRNWDTHRRRRASIDKARKLLKYEPRTTIDAGLERVNAWFEANERAIAQSARF